MKLIQFYYTLSCIFGCCCPIGDSPERPDPQRRDPNFRRNTEVIRIPGHQKIGGAMSRKDRNQELDNEEHEVLHENKVIVGVSRNFNIRNQRDADEFNETYHYLIDPLDLEWVESDAIPQLDQTTLLHDPQLIPHMIPLMQTMSDALPELGWGTVTEEKYREILDDHFRRFCLKTDLGYGMVHIVENGKAYMLQNPQISDEGYDEVVLNGMPTKLQGYRISGEKESSVLLPEHDINAELNKKVAIYYESLKGGKIYDIMEIIAQHAALFECDKIASEMFDKPISRALRSISIEEQLAKNPKLLSHLLFVCTQIGRRNLNDTRFDAGKDRARVQTYLMRMLPSFDNSENLQTLLQLYKHQDTGDILPKLELIKDLWRDRHFMPLILPFRSAAEIEGLRGIDLGDEEICYVDSEGNPINEL